MQKVEVRARKGRLFVGSWMSCMKRTLFTTTIIFLAVAICEVGAHGFYVLTRGKFVWQREEFRVGDFTQRIMDGVGFIDDCCRLSREGATRVARALVPHMPSPGL